MHKSNLYYVEAKLLLKQSKPTRETNDDRKIRSQTKGICLASMICDILGKHVYFVCERLITLMQLLFSFDEDYRT